MFEIGQKAITPTQVIKSGKCRHYFFLECFGNHSQKRREYEGERSSRQDGASYQDKIAAKIIGRGQKPVRYSTIRESVAMTRKAMQDGVANVYPGVLGDENMVGIPHILRKIERESLLGDYSYEPIDIRNRRQVTQADRLQLFFYSFLLEPILGYRPRKGSVWLNQGSLRDVPLDSKLEYRFFQIVEQLKEIQQGKLKTQPVRCSVCSTCPWIDVCTEAWIQEDHVSLLSGVGTELGRKLETLGLKTCRQVASAKVDDLVKALDLKTRVAERLVLAAAARSQNKAIILKKPEFPEGKPVYFYDIETNDDRVFIHGLIRLHRGKREEKFFFANSVREERKQWHAFLDYLAQDRDAIVYCWTNYERQFVSRLWNKYKGNPKGYGHLKDRLIDQCAFVRDHFALPCRGYSIKAVAPLFGFRWHVPNANGMNCVAWYRQWAESRSPKMREKIIEYNLDDVRAMEVIDQELKKLIGQKGSGA